MNNYNYLFIKLSFIFYFFLLILLRRLYVLISIRNILYINIYVLLINLLIFKHIKIFYYHTKVSDFISQKYIKTVIEINRWLLHLLNVNNNLFPMYI
jgi:hypothetical protein